MEHNSTRIKERAFNIFPLVDVAFTLKIFLEKTHFSVQYDIYHNAAIYYTDEQDNAVKEVTN